MIALLWFVLAILASPFKSKSRLGAENAALRQLFHRPPHPNIVPEDPVRVFLADHLATPRSCTFPNMGQRGVLSL